MQFRSKPFAIIFALTILILPILLGGCGGGAPGGVDVSADRVKPDLEPVVVTGTDPVDGAVDVPVDKTVIVFFNEDIEPLATAKWNQISIANGETPVEITKSIDGNQLLLDPVLDLDNDVTYTVTVPKESVGAIVPPEENNGGGRPLKETLVFTFTTTSAYVPTPPVVVSSDPAEGAVGIYPDKTITVTFNKEVVQGANWNSIALAQGQSPVPVNLSISATDEKVLVVDPQGDLALDTSFVLTVPAGAVNDKESGTEPLASDFVLNFQTGGPPVVTATDPVDGDDNVPTTKTVTVTFSEPVLEGTNWGQIELKTGQTQVAASTSINGSVLTIDPVLDLEKNTQYTVTIPAGAVNDQDGFGLGQTVTFSFTTTDPPMVTGSDPTDGVNNVDLDKTLTVTFSKDVEAGDNWSGITLKAGQTTVATVNTINGNTLSINPDADLSQDTTYTVTVPAGAVKGVEFGNPLPDEFTFSFITGYPPTVTLTSPADQAVDVPTGTIITVTFDENFVPGDNWSAISLTCGATPVPFSISYQDNVLTLTPASRLLVNSGYTVNLPAGAVRDLVGNQTTQGYAFTFATDNLFFFEDFSNGIPATWTIVDGYNDGATWEAAADLARYNLGLPFTEPCGVVDSDLYGTVTMDEQLITPDIDISNGTNGQVFVSFANCFKYYAYGPTEVADVDVLPSGESTWVNVLRMHSDNFGPELRVIDLSTIVAGKAGLKIRFHYYDAQNDFWWVIDDVKVYEP
jgi:methionine-rich copper-binding protein CopC